MGDDDSFLALLVYVDDIIIIGPNLAVIDGLKQFLHGQFKFKDLGHLKFFLGLEIARSSAGLVLSQRYYALQLLEDSGYLACKPAAEPMDAKIQLCADEGSPLSDASQYRRWIGRLLYLTITCPDITFVVHKLSQFLTKPREPYLQAVHHLLRYIKASPGQGLFYYANSSIQLKAFSDADWSSCPDSRKSMTGFCIFVGDSLVSWKSK
ncbi:uncharacterized protein LOC112094104 [Morus notabilis]|uniref:uncharacterized protein LOC112094104 n=1 Tax=Morus notabilis TaxID=981085 RepID=UPI000CED3E2D|nr:uncharacterized protein LOC112094104 [Morus notabilis]